MQIEHQVRFSVIDTGGHLMSRSTRSLGARPAPTARHRKRAWLAAGVGLVSAAVAALPWASADELAEGQAALAELVQRLDALRQAREAAQASRDATEAALREAEQAATRLREELAELDERLARTRDARAAAEQRLDQAERAWADAAGRLARLIVARERLVERSPLALVLRTGPEFERAVAYLRYLDAREAERAQDAATLAEEVLHRRAALSVQLSQLEATLAERRARRAQLAATLAQRRDALAQRTTEVEVLGERLARAKVEHNRLSELVASLESALADIPQVLAGEADLGAQRGRLGWPLSPGSVSALAPRRGGVLIPSPRGEPVRAVAHGRVVFADWLTGFGRLLILEHGHGYLSLYGHNERVYPVEGAWIDRGEIIATVGDSGGLPGPGLYFALRQGEKSLDPQQWCNIDGEPVQQAAR